MKKVSVNKFFQLVGAVNSLKALQKYNPPIQVLKKLEAFQSTEEPLGWEACGESLELLKQVCKANPSLHIFTQVDGDSSRDIFYENSVRIVNRNIYYLGTKNKDLEIYCQY